MSPIILGSHSHTYFGYWTIMVTISPISRRQPWFLCGVKCFLFFGALDAQKAEFSYLTLFYIIKSIFEI